MKFTPEYLNELVETTSAAAADFNMYLTNDVIDSIVGLFEHSGKISIAPSNQYRIKLLEQSGILVSNIEREIEKRIPGLDKKIREAFYQAGYDINEDINQSVSETVESDKELNAFVGKAPRLENLTTEEKQILNAAYKRTNGEIHNLTRTTAADINQQFLKSCDTAWWKATHGISAETAIREAIDEVSQHGAYVVYRHGGKERRLTVESAVRMCVLTGINQAKAEITLAHCADMGMKTVIVDSHLGARYTDKDEPANHQSWQGKVYSLSDSLLKQYGYEEKTPEKNIFHKIKEFFQKFRKSESYPDFETVTGYGTIVGLCGINCRHGFSAFDPRYNVNTQPQYDSEENKKAYDLSQKQRALERNIRNAKKQLLEVRHAIAVANDKSLIDELKIRESEAKKYFDKQNTAYTSFCRQNGLTRRENRLYVGKNSGNYIANSGDSGIITSGAVSGALNPYGNAAGEHAVRYYGLVRSMTTDVKKIAQATGFAEKDILDIKNYIFMERHDLGNGKLEYFTPDYMMAETWRRLISGKPEPHDLTMLKHEMMERELMLQGMPQDQAHIETSKIYDYGKEAAEFYDKIKKYRKEK